MAWRSRMGHGVAQIVHLLYKIVIFGGCIYIRYIRYAHLKPSIFWRFGAQIWRICEI